MSITSILRNLNGSPNLVFIQSTDTLAEITTTGYLVVEQPNIELLNNGEFTFNSDDVCAINYADGLNWFKPDLTTNAFTPIASGGEVELPVVAGNFTVFADTDGNLKDEGYLPSDATKTRVVMASGATVINNTPVFSDVTGSVEDSGHYETFGQTATWGGGATNHTFGVPGITASSIISLTFALSTNPASITGYTPGANTIQVFFSADPGASTVLSYFAKTPNP